MSNYKLVADENGLLTEFNVEAAIVACHEKDMDLAKAALRAALTAAQAPTPPPSPVALVEAARFTLETLDGHSRAWEHSGDEDTGQHDEDCRACEYDRLRERLRAALAHLGETNETEKRDGWRYDDPPWGKPVIAAIVDGSEETPDDVEVDVYSFAEHGTIWSCMGNKVFPRYRRLCWMQIPPVKLQAPVGETGRKG
jgi:hypothetical protein